MASIPSERDLRSWIEDSIHGGLTAAQLDFLTRLLEPMRECIEAEMERFEPEEQSWRDYRNSMWSLLPPELDKEVDAWLKRFSRGEAPPPEPPPETPMNLIIIVNESTGELRFFKPSRHEAPEAREIPVNYETALIAVSGLEPIKKHIDDPKAPDTTIPYWRAGPWRELLLAEKQDVPIMLRKLVGDG